MYRSKLTETELSLFVWTQVLWICHRAVFVFWCCENSLLVSHDLLSVLRSKVIMSETYGKQTPLFSPQTWVMQILSLHWQILTIYRIKHISAKPLTNTIYSEGAKIYVNVILLFTYFCFTVNTPFTASQNIMALCMKWLVRKTNSSTGKRRRMCSHLREKPGQGLGFCWSNQSHRQKGKKCL